MSLRNDVFSESADPPARRVFELLHERGLVEGEGWDAVEGYGCRHPLAGEGEGVELILFRARGPALRLAVDTDRSGRADDLGELLVRIVHVLESSGAFRRADTVERDAEPWRIPSMALREGAWELETRAWGRDAGLVVQDPELLEGGTEA